MHTVGKVRLFVLAAPGVLVNCLGSRFYLELSVSGPTTISLQTMQR